MGWYSFGDSEAAAIYEIWLRHFNGLLISDDLRGSLLHEQRGNQIQAIVDELKAEFIYDVIHKNERLKHDWCDLINTTEKETCEELALIALDEAIHDLNRTIGLGKTWGDIYETHYAHQAFRNTNLLDTIFDRSISAEGHRFSVNRVDWQYTEENGYRAFSTAGYRQIIDFSDESRSLFINPTGQSGNIVSEHYDDNIVAFKQLKLWPMDLDTKQKAKEYLVLKLEPLK